LVRNVNIVTRKERKVDKFKHVKERALGSADPESAKLCSDVTSFAEFRPHPSFPIL
jgi:hypothetical protein